MAIGLAKSTNEDKERSAQKEMEKLMSRKDDMDNHSNQLNPNNDAFWHSRDYDGRPDNWEEIYERSSSSSID